MSNKGGNKMRKTWFVKTLSIALSVAMVVLCFAAVPVMATITTIYVSEGATGGDGSLSKPYGTITAAAAAAQNDTIIQVDDGTYTEDVSLSNFNGITIRPVTKTSVIIHGSVSVTNCSNITIQDLKITAGTDKTAISLTDCANAVINHNEIKDSKVGVELISTGTRNVNSVISNKIKNCTTAIVNKKITLEAYTNLIYGGETGIDVVKTYADKYDFANAGELHAYQNTFYNISGYSITSDQPITIDEGEHAGQADLNIHNNIFARAERGKGVFVNLAVKGHGFWMEHNFYDANEDDLIVHAYGINENLTQCRGNEDDTSSVLGDAKFQDAANGVFTIASDSSAVSIGTSMTMPQKDLTGNAYDALGQDAGAYDHSSVDEESGFLKGVREQKNYTVDAGLASSSSVSFQTLAQVPTLQAGDSLTIKEGNYTGSIAVKDLQNTVEKPVVIKGEGHVVITSDKEALTLTNVSHVVVSNLTLRTTVDHETEQAIAKLDGVDYADIHNCTFDTNAYFALSVTNINHSNIYCNDLRTDRDLYWQGTTNENNHVYNNVFTGWRGIYSWSGVVKNNTINNNTFDCEAIAFDTGEGASFDGNMIQNNYFAAGPSFAKTGIDTNNTWDYNAYKSAKYTGEGEHSIENVTAAFEEGSYLPKIDGGLVGSGDSNVMPEKDFAGNKRISGDIGAYASATRLLSDFDLTNITVDEGQEAGAVVGTFLATNPAQGTNYAFSLVGEGNDNASFTIDGSTLKTAAKFDYTAKNTYTIGAAVSDGKNVSAVKNFTITIKKVDKTPDPLPAFDLSNKTISENNAAGATIGQWEEANPIEGKTYTYQLVAGAADNAAFSIQNKALKANNSFDYETKASYTIQVTISDGVSTSQPVSFVITIKDVNENKTTGGTSGTNTTGGSTNTNTSTSNTTNKSHVGSVGASIELPEVETATSYFKDLTNHWAKNTVQYIYSYGLISGYGDETVRPDNRASRAEFVSMITRMLNLGATPTSDYKDVSEDDWYAEAVAAAVANGLISGYTDGTFHPNATITREEAMVIAARVLQYLNVDIESNTAALNSFADQNQISSWAKDAVATLVSAGIMTGSNGRINPKANITRAEICVIMQKIMSQYMS